MSRESKGSERASEEEEEKLALSCSCSHFFFFQVLSSPPRVNTRHVAQEV